MRSVRSVVVALFVFALAPLTANAQTATYHLHNESSSNPLYRALKSAGPDTASVAIQSVDLKNHSAGTEMLTAWETMTGVPGVGGTIPGSSTVTFTLWMKKTASFGVISAYASIQLSGSTVLCSSEGAQLSTTLSPIGFSCQTPPSPITMTSSDQFRMFVGYVINTSPGNKSVKVELDFEGILEGNYDSRVVVPLPPPPSIGGLNPASGPVNWNVTVSGANFGATQGTSTLTFNGTPATPTSWSDTSISAPVPTGATTGPVVATVTGTASNGVNFTVVPPPTIASVVPATAHRGDNVTITGANFLSTQGASTVTFNGSAASPSTWSDTTIVTPVPAAATTGPVVVTVSAQASNSTAFTVILPGTIAGTITRTTGGTPLMGAAVQAVLQGVIKSTTTTPADGTYSIPNLDPATYDLRVHATGYFSEVRSTVVPPDATATVNVAMSQPGSIGGTVTQANGTTPIPGAAVTMFLAGIEKGRTSTNASGGYSIPALHTGSYTLQVAYVGYGTHEQGALVTENTNTVANVSLSPAPGGPVNYAYDELGRLVSVVDPSGAVATYTYDAVGNILSIGRIGAGTVAITEFTPNSSSVGAVVTIYGTGFSATAGQNTITFNGTPAVVTSATPTKLVTTVPAGAATGPIAVTTPTGSATSNSNYIVTADPGVPAITGFTPTIGPAGTVVTVSGSNFETVAANNRVTVNETFATVGTVTATSIATTIPASSTSGRIKVATPKGTAVSADDFFIPPPPYVATDVVFTSRMGYGDANALSVPVNTAGKIALVLFDGEAGHRVALKISGATYSGGSVKGFKPHGGQLLDTGFTTLGVFIDPKLLFASGAYTLLVDPNLSFVGSVTLTLYDVPPDFTGPIVPGGAAIPVPLDTPGQNARLTFTGVPGQKIAVSASVAPVGKLAILKPDGSTLGWVSTGTSPSFLDTLTLPVAGTYTVLVDPDKENTGSLTVTLHDAADVPMSIVPGGSAVVATTTTPGQRVVASFTASATQRVSLKLSNLSVGTGLGCKGSVSIVDSNQTVLRQNTCLVVTSDAFLDVTDALAAGTYAVIFDPAGSLVGSATLTLYDVPPDVTGTLIVNASPTPVTFSQPGQNASFTFEGALNETVKVRIDPNSLTPTRCVLVEVVRQTGSVVLSSANACGTTYEVQHTLSAADTYIVKLDPSGPNAGTLSVRVFNP